MKLLHTSDWHLGHSLYNYDRTLEQTSFLNQLTKIVRAEEPDAMVVCGDVFHYSNPSVAAQRLYNDALINIHQACPGMTIVVTAGNHDSPSKLEVDSMLWQHFGVNVIGGIERKEDGSVDLDKHVVEIKGKDEETAGYIAAVSYVYTQNYPLLSPDANKENRQHDFFQALLDHIRSRNERQLPVVLTAHLAVTGSDTTGHSDIVGGMDYTDISQLGSGYDYLALGHLHRPQGVEGSKARYSGSPIPVSFDEQYDHSVTVVEMESGGNCSMRTININNPMPLITIPKEPLPLEDALAELKALPKERQGYIRLQVKTDGYLPTGSYEKAVETTKGKDCKFCLIKPVINRGEGGAQAVPQFTVKELRDMDPLKIANLYYRKQYNSDMKEEMTTMFKKALERVNERMANNRQ